MDKKPDLGEWALGFKSESCLTIPPGLLDSPMESLAPAETEDREAGGEGARVGFDES